MLVSFQKASKASDRKMAEDDDDELKQMKLPEGIVDLETVSKKFKSIMRKQDMLLYVCRYCVAVLHHARP